MKHVSKALLKLSAEVLAQGYLLWMLKPRQTLIRAELQDVDSLIGFALHLVTEATVVRREKLSQMLCITGLTAGPMRSCYYAGCGLVKERCQQWHPPCVWFPQNTKITSNTQKHQTARSKQMLTGCESTSTGALTVICLAMTGDCKPCTNGKSDQSSIMSRRCLTLNNPKNSAHLQPLCQRQCACSPGGAPTYTG